MNMNIIRYHRHSIRLPDYDYASVGGYFITICAKEKQCFFGEIKDGYVLSNGIGDIVRDCWLAIPEHFPGIKICDFVVMPNHVHGILQNCGEEKQSKKNKLSSIIRGFKVGVTQRVGFSVWQRNYYEHVIRNVKDYERIAEYIANNPLRWEFDEEYSNV